MKDQFCFPPHIAHVAVFVLFCFVFFDYSIGIHSIFVRCGPSQQLQHFLFDFSLVRDLID
jgi:hypothetical protein